MKVPPIEKRYLSDWQKEGPVLDEQLPITRRQFHILLNQIQMTDDDLSRYFEEGEIVKLTVHKLAKTWHFLILHKLLVRLKSMIRASRKSSFNRIGHIVWKSFKEFLLQLSACFSSKNHRCLDIKSSSKRKAKQKLWPSRRSTVQCYRLLLNK